MDTTQSDENVLMTNDPLDVVEHVLAAENLPFDRTEDGDLAFSLAGDWKDYELWFAWRPEGDTLQLCLSMDLAVPKAQRQTAQELIATINPRVWLGHFGAATAQYVDAFFNNINWEQVLGRMEALRLSAA